MPAEKKIRIAIADPFKINRQALCHMLSKEDDLEIVGEAEDSAAATQLVKDLDVDVLILEPARSQKDGIEVIRNIQALDKPTKILILSVETGIHHAYRMLRANVSGWLSKTIDFEELLVALRSVTEGNIYLQPELQRMFAERYLRPASVCPPEEKLSEREYQVMRLLALGNTNREISEKLHIGVKTVDTHRANLLRKLELRNNADLTRFAIKNGLISL